MNYEMLTPGELKKQKLKLQEQYLFKPLNKEEENDLNVAIELAMSISKKNIVFISFTYNKTNYFKQPKGYDSNSVAYSKFLKNFSKEEHVIEVPDARTDIRCNKDILVTGKEGIQFFCGISILAKTTHLGTLCIFDRKPGKLTGTQKKELQAVCQLIKSLLEIREQKTQLEVLNSGLLNALQLQLKEQNKVLNLFSRFVPATIVKRHLRSDDQNYNDAELKNVTVLFCDIRGYTRLVEKLHPSEAVSVLKLYYQKMSDVINSHGGMVNQYVGDEIFAIFGEPFTKNPIELNAVLCAIGMMDKIKLVNKEVGKMVSGKIKVGIGIHSGPVVTGTLGSKEKIEYSVTGDTVNTGKRIESHTQNKPGTILISEAVYKQVKDSVKVIRKKPIVVKGKSAPIPVYEVVQNNSVNQTTK